MITVLHLRRAVDGNTDCLQEFLREAHHPVVILILNIEFHTGELRIVVFVHTLVAEVLADLVDTLKATDDESLEVELCSDTHVHIDVQGIEMGDERTGAGTTGDRLQNRRLHLRISGLVEEVTHRTQHGGTLEERVLDAIVDDEVDITLTGAQLGIVELIIGHAILVFHDGQRFEALAEEFQALGMDTHLSGLCLKNEAFDADKVTDVKEFLEDLIIEVLVLVGTDIITGDIDLNTALGVLELNEAGLTHDTTCHHTAGDDDFAFLALFVFCLDIRTEGIGGKLGCWIGVDTHVAQLLKTLAATNLLFA